MVDVASGLCGGCSVHLWGHRCGNGGGTEGKAGVNFDAGMGGTPCVSLRAAGRHRACGRQAATGAAPGCAA